MKLSARRLVATAAITALGAVPIVGAGPAGALVGHPPVASASCVNAQTPGGTKCLQSGEFCSHKPGYAAAYKRAGFKCKANGRLTER
jgi:hypothetical protein